MFLVNASFREAVLATLVTEIERDVRVAYTIDGGLGAYVLILRE
jgi:hypothetical protein